MIDVEYYRNYILLSLGKISMFRSLLKNFFSSTNTWKMKDIQHTVNAINNLESQVEKLSDDQLSARTQLFRDRLKLGQDLTELIPDAFATVREVSKRIRGERHYDVQLMGGIVLTNGKIIEMKTGEGKTLVSTLPVYLNALQQKSVHVVTVNDYLAHRDAESMKKLYNFLGLSVGVITNDMNDNQRKSAYQCDITYATNNELGFDYMRDNMKFSLQDIVQRPLNFALIDEVDSILIDEARTPLIISGPIEDNSDFYHKINNFILQLTPDDYEIDEIAKIVSLSEQGVERAENILRKMKIINEGTLYCYNNLYITHYISQALRAHHLFQCDVDYIVHNNKVIIIDEFTGRMMEGRRYSDGLHQALEVKEKVDIQNETQTLASITFQNYFRQYPILSGMTGTAVTESQEFEEIYNLQVIEIPTHRPIIRKNYNDEIYRTAEEKWNAITNLLQECYNKNQPALVGTVSIEKSEQLSRMLKKRAIPHEILNAKQHESEASIIAQAGKPQAITIATNMAGRGTDIKLGGNIAMQLLNVENQDIKKIEKLKKEVLLNQKQTIQAGGLFVIGTERNESRRVDNQLRGRSGRQGDPGCAKFFLSLEDDLMRIFGSNHMQTMLQKIGLRKGEALHHKWINKAIEKAQQKVERRNFDLRKTLLKFDDVINDQRKVIYEQRTMIMSAENINEYINDICNFVIESIVRKYCIQKIHPSKWNYNSLYEDIFDILGIKLPIKQWLIEDNINPNLILKRVQKESRDRQKRLFFQLDNDNTIQTIQKTLILQILDKTWKDHLFSIDHLREGIGLRAYGQRDPLNEFKSEAFNLFQNMLAILRERITYMIHKNELKEDTLSLKKIRRENIISRNQACPCGSNKKYKHCHGIIRKA